MNMAKGMLQKTFRGVVKEEIKPNEKEQKLMGFGINTVSREMRAKLESLRTSTPPKRPRTAKSTKKKRLQKNSDEDEDGVEYGELIPEFKTQLIAPIDKSSFKYFKPWI